MTTSQRHQTKSHQISWTPKVPPTSTTSPLRASDPPDGRVRINIASHDMLRAQLPPFWRTRAWRKSPLPVVRRASTRAERIDRITSKLPHRLQKYTRRLRDAPLSHVVSFMILHEITAIVPLFGLFGLFHYTDYVPVSYITDHCGDYVQSGVSRFERYFKRKGWFGFSQDEEDGNAGHNGKAHTEDVMERWQSGDAKYKILGEIALAYGVTKALLPLRIIGSVWATPWLARLLDRARATISRKS